MKSARILGLLILLAVSLLARGQNEYSNWYFHDGVGISFNSGNPVELFDSDIYTYESAATISDVNGNLLFYTDAYNVWNRYHVNINPNTPMLGNWSASDGAFAVQKPGSPTVYYIFTTDGYSPELPGDTLSGIHYSVLDIDGNGGQGELIQLNVPLMLESHEKFTAIKHANDVDVWLIAPKWDSDEILAWLLTENGIQPPIVSHTGVSVWNSLGHTKAGQSKGSPDGKWYAMGIAPIYRRLMILQFDDQTGVLSNPISTSYDRQMYGVEFSASSKYLYAGTVSGTVVCDLYQFDLESQDIISSETFIATHQLEGVGLQLSPDRKIYRSNENSTILSVINNADSAASAVTFDSSGFQISAPVIPIVSGGLPRGLSSEIVAPNFNYNYHCFGDTAFFTLLETEFESVHWDFGDTLSGNLNHSTELNPLHVYQSPGYHRVTLTLINGADSLHGYHWVRATWPTLDLGADTSICPGTNYTIDLVTNGTVYTWQDTDTTPSYGISQAGTYWVEADLEGCVDTDTLVVGQYAPIPITLGPDTSICEGDDLSLEINQLGFYSWSTGDSIQTISVDAEDTYWVNFTDDSGCVQIDSIHVLLFDAPSIQTPPWIICLNGPQVQLSAFPSSGDWIGVGVDSTGLFNPFVAGLGQHQVYYELESPDCSFIDSTQLNVINETLTIMNDGDSLYLPSPIGFNFQWFLNGVAINGANSTWYIAASSGNYHVEYLDGFGCPAETFILEFTASGIGISDYDHSEFMLHPNPTTGIVYVSGTKVSDLIHSIQVFDPSGRLVLTEDLGASFDLSTVESGVYFVYINSALGVQVDRIVRN